MGADEPSEVSRRGWIAPVIVAIGGILAVALRLYVISADMGALDADEAVPGLMARHVLEGEIPIFYWGQNYGGSAEVLLTAPVFAIFGSSTWTLRLIPLTLFVVSAVFIWRIGLYLTDRVGAAIASTLFLVWPGWLVWKSLKANAFYGTLAATATAILLVSLQINAKPTIKRYALLGVLIGLGWWNTPQIALIALPVLAWLLVVTRDLRIIPTVTAAALLGAAPWLLWNLTNEWASLTQAPDLPGTTYGARLRGFWTDVLPTALSLRVPVDGSWVARPVFSQILYATAIGAFIWFSIQNIRRSNVPATLIIGILVTYPFLYAVSPFTWYLSEPRYLVPFLASAALIIGWSARRSMVVTFVVVAWLIPLSAVQLMKMEQVGATIPRVANVPVPSDMEPLIETLTREDVTHVFADYWLAYRISFESDEKIIATSTTHVRYPPHDEAVRDDPDAASVFIAGSTDEQTFRATTSVTGWFREVQTDGFVIFIPDRGEN